MHNESSALTNVHKIKYLRNAYSTTGTSFTDTTLENVLYNCLNLPTTGKKGSFGAIFVYDSEQLAEHCDDTLSTGIILLDIDHITKDIADKIYDNFYVLVGYFPQLLAIQFSSSYYINPQKKCGLHIYVKSEQLNVNEYYKTSLVCLAAFAQIVNIALDIDFQKIEKENNVQILDEHNANMWQRFVLYHSSFKYNEYATTFSLKSISFEDLEKLVKIYDLKLDNVVSKVISPVANNLSYGGNIEKIKVDKFLHIGNYSGNNIRYRISIIAEILFGENAKSFCDKYFYYENGKSIYTHYSQANTVNPLIYKWLVSKGYIVEDSKNKITNWISEYKNDIINFIKTNKVGEIIAPTGCGKTTFINNELAKEFNSVVIVPFNATNKLYDKLFEVNADYCGDIPKNKPIVMIWDQAIKHWGEIKDRHFIVDEAHTLFFDRNYRDTAIKLIDKFKENNNSVTFITATPAGESELFDGCNKISYYKDRKTLKLNIKTTTNIEYSQFNYIKKCLDEKWYDKIVLLDDSSAKKIYEQFLVHGYAEQIAYIRSETKGTPDFIDLCNNELLTKRLTICTCVAFNGINFKNTNENILVVGSIRLGVTTSCEMIQQIGRVRNSNVTGIYFYNPELFYKEDIDKKEIKALECNKMVVNGCDDTFLSYDRKYLNSNYVNVMRNIQEFQLNHSNIDTIASELSMTGYIKGSVESELKDEKNVKKMSLAQKRLESDEMKDDIINDRFDNKEYESKYQQEWAKEIRYIISNNNYSGITIETIKDMFKNGTKHKLVDTCINNIKDIVRYISIDNSECDKVIKNMNLYASMLSNSVDKKQFISNVKRIKKIRKEYANKIKLKNDLMIYDDIIRDVIQWESENQEKMIEGAKNGGKIGGKIGGKKTTKIKDLQTDIIYESCNECAKAIGHNATYISKHKERFIKI